MQKFQLSILAVFLSLTLLLVAYLGQASAGRITSAYHGMCLYTDNHPFDNNVRVVDCSKGNKDRKDWRVTDTGLIISGYSGMCLYTDNHPHKNSVRVVDCERGGKNRKRWRITDSGLVISAENGMCLYTDNHPFDNNVRVVDCEKGNKRRKQWELYVKNGTAPPGPTTRKPDPIPPPPQPSRPTAHSTARSVPRQPSGQHSGGQPTSHSFQTAVTATYDINDKYIKSKRVVISSPSQENTVSCVASTTGGAYVDGFRDAFAKLEGANGKYKFVDGQREFVSVGEYNLWAGGTLTVRTGSILRSDRPRSIKATLTCKAEMRVR